jgi:CO/xanthine dehydrogenase Mo-binding subunit
MAYRLIGKDFLPPDVVAKVTGRAKYAEDFRVDGMLHAKLLTCPLPHARVTSIDAAKALRMPGVVAMLTADEVPQEPAANPILTNEPTFVGAPVLAVAAIDELTAAEAVDAITVDWEPLPFSFDPLASLNPSGANARSDGNVGGLGVAVKTVKWEAGDFAGGDARLPSGQMGETWQFGDLEGGFAAAKLVLEESFVTASVPHHTLETRSALAYWRNGKCFLHGSSQSHSFIIPRLAAYIGVEPENLVFIGEFCGGGFGSKGGAYPLMALPAHLARKTGRPVMMRISRAEEYFLGSGRHGFQGKLKIGFAADGRITALDVRLIQDQGGVIGATDYRSAGEGLAVVYQPLAMRWSGLPVFTNTPPCGPMRGPGQNQMAAAIEPLIDKAARQLGIDRVAIRTVNAPAVQSTFGPKSEPMSSCYLKEALDKGAKAFGWEARVLRSGQRRGSKVTGIGVGQAFHSAGFNGFDGLLRITPDGTLHVHSGVGNLGTYSFAGTSRVAAEVLNYDWDHVVIEHGDSRRALPWNSVQAGSNTTFTETRTNYVAAMDLRRKLLEIAAKDLGGTPDDYDLGAERVVAKADPAKVLTFAQAAKRAVQLGGAFSGRDLPADIHAITRQAASAIAGTGLIGVAKDNLPKSGLVPGFCAAFVEIALDVETGQVTILDHLATSDVGLVVHPQSIDTQIKGGSVMGIGMARFERRVYDPRIGVPANVGLTQTKPPSWLDGAASSVAATVDAPETQNPMGVKGVGEPPTGATAAAVLSAISDALGGHLFNRVPVAIDMIINALADQPPPHRPLQVHTV